MKKLVDEDLVYCLEYGKEECPTCERNVTLYEYDSRNIQLFWTDSYKIQHSRAKRCPKYKRME